MNVRVVKIGGAALADAGWLSTFAAAAAAAREPLVIVHGGGPEISALSDRLGIAVRWHEGRRVTPPEALDVAAMVLNGSVNRRVVSALVGAGVDALGLCGVDGGLLRAELVENGALGRVGHIVAVRTELLGTLLRLGHTLVLSPVSLAPDGDALNVNADDAAAAVAAALGAEELLFLTDVPGVRDTAGMRPWLDADEAAALIDAGVAYGGMRVKLHAAVKALDCGVPAIRIGDVRMLFDHSAGTVLRPVSLGAA
ncbi:MAG TPA: acetylglutamate kinase [Longimicrobiales bacterium]